MSVSQRVYDALVSENLSLKARIAELEAENQKYGRHLQTQAMQLYNSDLRIAELEAALKNCADVLADEIEGRYSGLKDHPAMKSRYDRDMNDVVSAREKLKVGE